jgi:hypothetical protein
MKKLLVATLLLASAVSKADVIKCSFTEPFVDTVYSMTASTLTIRDAVGQKARVVKNVSFQIKGPGEFELVGKDGKVLQKLKLTMNGSDGMSDTIYPYEVTDTNQLEGGMANGGVGGCSSNYLKTKQQPEGN